MTLPMQLEEAKIYQKQMYLVEKAETDAKAKLAQFGYNVNQKMLLKSFNKVEDAWERYETAYLDYLNLGISVVNEAYATALKELT